MSFSNRLSNLRRRSPTREERERVLIVTEGDKTEPEYFKSLIRELGLTTAKVCVIGSGDSSDPSSLVAKVGKELEKDPDFEKIYIVFDRDQHATYDKALSDVEKIKKKRYFKSKSIEAITSVPCFEIWFMLHSEYTERPYQRSKDLLDCLKTKKVGDVFAFSNYEKSSCRAFYEKISPYRSYAKNNAKKILNNSSCEKSRHYINPSTLVHEVVEFLELLSKK